MFSVKIHNSYRTVVAICDSNLIGKRFEDEKRQLEIKEHFFKGEEVDEKELRRTIQMQLNEDATFNIVGENSVKIAVEEGAIIESGITEIQGIKFALKLI